LNEAWVFFWKCPWRDLAAPSLCERVDAAGRYIKPGIPLCQLVPDWFLKAPASSADSDRDVFLNLVHFLLLPS